MKWKEYKELREKIYTYICCPKLFVYTLALLVKLAVKLLVQSKQDKYKAIDMSSSAKISDFNISDIVYLNKQLF